jgi:uncharacterized small protein (DUF1192 family)
MKLIRTILALLCASVALLRADVLILKNGEKKEGTILEEKPDAIFMEYNVVPSGKIKDKKDFPRADIAQIIKQSPQEIEIVPLKKLLPTKDMMSADQYEKIIQDQMRPFVNKFPGTPEAKEVEAMIATLQEERGRVVKGELQIEGKWVAADLVKRDDYNIQAFKMRTQMLEKAGEGEFESALKIWDQLSDPVLGYPGAIHYVKATDEAIETLGKYETVIKRMIDEQPVLQAQRDASIGKLIEPDKSRVERAIKAEVDAWKAKYEAEKKGRTKWLPLYKYDLKSLQDAHKLVLTERSKLTAVDKARLAMQNDAITAAMRYLADENVMGADEAITRAAAVGLKDYQKVIAAVRSKITQLKAELNKRKASNRAFSGSSSAVGGSSGAITDDKVAEAMKKAMESKDEKKGEGAAPAAGTAKSGEEAPKPSDEGKAKKKAKAPAAAPESVGGSLADAAAEDDGGGLQKILIYAAGGLVLLLLIAFMVQQKKKKA